MSNELLPCPFCEAPGEHDSHDMRDLVFCSNPKCDWAHNHGIRTATWNTRPDNTAVTALRDIAKINPDVPDCRDKDGNTHQSVWLYQIIRPLIAQASIAKETP